MRGALYALRILARKYEFKDEEERGPLAPIVAGFLPPLLLILQVGGAQARPGQVRYTCHRPINYARSRQSSLWLMAEAKVT